MSAGRTNAVCVFCDDAYFPVASILCAQAAAEADRDFDVVLFLESRATELPALPADAGYEVRRIDMDGMIPAGSQFSNRISRAAYNRLFIGTLLEPRYTRALYLDCDIALRGPVSPLFGLPLGRAPLAAVADCGFVKRPGPAERGAWEAYLRRIGLADPTRYFNSGVLLADLAAWRQRDMGALIADFMGRHGAIVTGMDQDTLNVIFQGEWLELSPRWNFQLLYFGFGLEQVLDPAILHYVDNLKPWHDLVFWWGREHVEDFRARFAAAGFPDFMLRARRREHYRRFAKWRARALLRPLPFMRGRFERENARRRMFRDLAVAHIAQALRENRYADVNAGLTRVSSADVERLADARVLTV